MVVVTALDDFYRMYNRLKESGKNPRWFSIKGAYYICNERILEEAKKRYA